MTTLSPSHATLQPRYVFPNTKSTAAERLNLLSQIFDPITAARTEHTGITSGWSCWEIGAGSGTIAELLKKRVAPRGRVLATDIEPRLLQSLAGGGLEVRQHDIVRDPLSSERFDLIHTRLLLCHLPQREAVLDRLISALKPGGWLLVEDFDALSLLPDPEANSPERNLATSQALREFMRRSGVDLRFARSLSAKMRDRGLTQVSAEGKMFMIHEGSPFARFHRLTFEQVRDDLIAARLVTADEFAADVTSIETNYTAPSPIFWSVAGRRGQQ